MQATIGVLCLQTWIAISPILHFECTCAHNLKNTGCIWTFYISDDYTTIKDAAFWLKAVCEPPLVSYGSKHAWQPLSNMPFVHTYMHNLKITGVYGRSIYQTVAVLLETFFLWFRVVWEIRLESYSSLRSFSNPTLCVYASISKKYGAPATLLHSN